MDIISILLLIFGVLAILVGLMKGMGRNSTLVGVVGLFLIILGGLGFLGIINFSKYTNASANVGPVQANVGYTTSVPSTSTSSSLQPSDCTARGTTSNANGRIAVTYRNVENASGNGFIAATISANQAGGQVDTTTTNSGGAGTAATVMSNVPLCYKGDLIATVSSGTGVESSDQVYDFKTQQLVSGFDLSTDGAKVYEVQGASADVVSCDASDFTGAIAGSWETNGSTGAEVTKDSNGHFFVSAAGTSDGNFYFRNTSISTRGSINFQLNCQVNNTGSTFGSYNKPDSVIFSYTVPTSGASKFSANSLTLASNIAGWALTKVQCPVGITNNRNAKACWTAPMMRAGTLYQVKGTLTADTGDPVIGDQPSINIDNRVLFRDIDNTIQYGTYNKAGTHQGVGGTIINFPVS